MRNKASGFVKQIISALIDMARSKTQALKSKTRAFKTRLVIFSLLRNRKILMSSISQKLKALGGHHDTRGSAKHEDPDVDDETKTMVVYNTNAMSSEPGPLALTCTEYGIEDDEEKYPDLTHSLFDVEDLGIEDTEGSVIDIVKNSKEDKGEEFRLEDEIDRVADLFIKRFHRQMWMQKQLSFKRYQETLERNA